MRHRKHAQFYASVCSGETVGLPYSCLAYRRAVPGALRKLEAVVVPSDQLPPEEDVQSLLCGQIPVRVPGRRHADARAITKAMSVRARKATQNMPSLRSTPLGTHNWIQASAHVDVRDNCRLTVFPM